MKRLTITACAAALLLLACNNEKKTDEIKTDKDTTTASTTPAVNNEQMAQPLDSATMMKNMEAYGTPGDPHKMLARANGSWVTDITMWMAPGAPPITSKGTTVNKMIMGGRYQESDATGNMMGAPFAGQSVTGYDNAKKVFVSTWIDNMGTGIMKMEGPWDEANKTINLSGRAVDGSTMKEADYKQTFKMVDDNTQVMEMYGPGPDGKEYKIMEIKYTRKK
jgi:uncharacterized lipoprotein NlpE involved in copper resistance